MVCTWRIAGHLRYRQVPAAGGTHHVVCLSNEVIDVLGMQLTIKSGMQVHAIQSQAPLLPGASHESWIHQMAQHQWLECAHALPAIFPRLTGGFQDVFDGVVGTRLEEREWLQHISPARMSAS